MKTFIGYQQYLVEEIAATEIHNMLVATGAVAKHSKKSEPRVFNPGNKLSNTDFINLIKDTFDGVDKVTAIPPPNIKSRTNTIFNFHWEGIERSVTLAGEVKGRGSKQTEEQEVSWLLVLSAYYDDDTITDLDSLTEAMMKPLVYERVYGAKGSALTDAGARGLVGWLQGQKAWATSHMSQCKKFAKTYSTAPTRLLKDRSNMDITAIAKKLFPLAVPDQIFDKDKWNPADVWLEYDEFVPENYSTLDDINRYLKESINGSSFGILGVSLKAGNGPPKKINVKGNIPNYEVTGLKLRYGEFLAQNVTTEYAGNELTGYSVMYRLFDANAKSTIRGEAGRKKSLAMHGKVFLQYMDFLVGRGRVKSVESVKGVLVKQDKDGNYEFAGNGARALSKVKRMWKILISDQTMFQYNSKGVKDTNTYIKLLNTNTPDQEFLDYLTTIGKEKRISETSMQTRVSARFQTLVLGALFVAIKKKSAKKLYEIALGMLLYGKSESQWSAPHLKIE